MGTIVAKYARPRVGVGAFIVENNQLLLIKRAKPPEEGHWSIPGGKVEAGESLQEAVVREIYEEVGVDIEIHSLLDVTQHLIPALEQHWLAPSFLCSIKRGHAEIISPEEILHLGWYPFDGLPNPLTETTLAALRAYQRRLEGDISINASVTMVS